MTSVSSYFKNNQSYRQALVHRSYCNEHPGVISNERLEFLGDSILSFLISARLYRLLPQAPEGELTNRRSYLVQTSSLAQKSQTLHLDLDLLLSRGEEDSGGRSNPSLLANTFEAVLGALFMDSGLEACTNFIDEVFPDAELTNSDLSAKDPKSFLQEKAQSQGLGTPIYRIQSATGPDHAKKFTVSVKISGKSEGQGVGLSKQKAETAAAVAALAKLFPD